MDSSFGLLLVSLGCLGHPWALRWATLGLRLGSCKLFLKVFFEDPWVGCGASSLVVLGAFVGHSGRFGCDLGIVLGTVGDRWDALGQPLGGRRTLETTYGEHAALQNGWNKFTAKTDT